MEIVIDSRDELDSRIREKIARHECIHEPELLDRITDIMIERDILVDDIQCYHDKLKEVAEANRSKTERFGAESAAKADKSRLDAFGEYLQERKNTRNEVPEFEEGYVVVDATDGHVLDNRIFVDKEEAESHRKEYSEEMPSLVGNCYVVAKVTRDCLLYGAFPYENQMYFVYDLES